MEGKVPGSNNYSVEFQEPANPLAGVSSMSCDTNDGRDISTVSRKMPVQGFPGWQGDGPESATFEGTCLNLWKVMQMAAPLPKMRTEWEPEAVNSTFGGGTMGGTPGKASGVYAEGSFVSESVNSTENAINAPELPPYWNADVLKWNPGEMKND